MKRRLHTAAVAAFGPSAARQEWQALRSCGLGAVPETNWITMHWMDVSCERGYPFRSIPRDRVLCRPLPHKLPLPGFEHIR